MSITGNVVLGILQNNSTPKLDLLVRESIQNSLDAASNNVNSVTVKYDYKDILTSEFSKYFEEIDYKLQALLGDISSVLSIRDTNTVGLTGPRSYADLTQSDSNNHGNFIKLVYNVGQSQERKDTGGSWGYGKTIYFRMGIGLVIFYTRIKTKVGYESRLAATLVEDEKNKSSKILNSSSSKLNSGIAWWGDRDPNGESIPITDEKEIEEILNSFGIEQFQKDETGTTIIIPGLNEKRLLQEVVSEDEDGGQIILPWTSNICSYLEVATQRWYSPRLNNKKYVYGPSLNVVINEKRIRELKPFFKIVQQLYNSTPENPLKVNEHEFISKSIQLNKTFTSSAVAGILNFVILDKVDLDMIPPNNSKSPYCYIDNKENMDDNPSILIFARKLGMIISYKIDTDWTKDIPPLKNDQFLIAFFVPNSDNKIDKIDISFEEYLRKSEKADHMDWLDVPYPGNDFKPNIIERIKRSVRKSIKDVVVTRPKEDQTANRNFKLGRIMANLILPNRGLTPYDKGRGGAGGNGGSSGSGSSRKESTSSGNGSQVSNPRIEILDNPIFVDNSIEIQVRVLMGGCSDAYISMLILTEQGNINSLKWAKDFKIKYPVFFENISNAAIVQKNKVVALGDSVSITIEKDENCIKSNKIRIKADKNKYVLSFNIIYSMDARYRSTLLIKPKEAKK